MSTFVKVATQAELPMGGKKLVEVDGRAIAVFNVDGTLFAIDDVCTHDGGPLAEGELIGCEIECPRHGARFDVRTGAPFACRRSNRSPLMRSPCAAKMFSWRSMTQVPHHKTNDSRFARAAAHQECHAERVPPCPEE